MNEALEKAILKAIEIAEKTGEFVISEAPDLVSEFLAFQLIRNSLLVAVSFAFAIYFIKCIKSLPKFSEIEDDGQGIILVFSWVFMFLSIGCLIGFSIAVLKVSIAPKYYILDYFLNAV